MHTHIYTCVGINQTNKKREKKIFLQLFKVSLMRLSIENKSSYKSVLGAGPALQAFGFWVPTSLGVTFEHTNVGGPLAPLYSMLMSPISTFAHGCALLHNSFTASLFPDVPLIFLKLMSTSLIVDAFWLQKHPLGIRIIYFSLYRNLN